MLGEEKRSIVNLNLEKYPRQIQQPTPDLKMELLVKIVNDFKLQSIFAKKHHFRCVTVSEFASDCNKSMFLTSKKRAISRFFGMVAVIT